jgi:hypothetical protein
MDNNPASHPGGSAGSTPLTFPEHPPLISTGGPPRMHISDQTIDYSSERRDFNNYEFQRVKFTGHFTDFRFSIVASTTASFRTQNSMGVTFAIP